MMSWSPLWHVRPSTQRWGISLLAVLLPVLMLQIRVQLPIAFGERPLLVLFMLPIIVCALLGGLLPGLLCTLITALVTSLFHAPPDLFTDRVEAGQDLVQWGLLIANGLLISVLSAAFHRARAREVLRWQELMSTQIQPAAEREPLPGHLRAGSGRHRPGLPRWTLAAGQSAAVRHPGLPGRRAHRA
jgi:two-component system sensor histidine kinase/response regulator